MAIGINDFDEFEPYDDSLAMQEETYIDSPVTEESEDIVELLLRSRGIDDMSKIKFENEDGGIEERDWNTLSNQDKLNILNTSTSDPDTDLDDAEIQLINAIRSSRMSPVEYLQNIQTAGINNYIQYQSGNEKMYSVDQFSDEELYVADLKARTPDMTDQEALESLETAKNNEALFNKQIGAIRDEYKRAEDETLRQSQLEQEQIAQERYNHFANQIANQISNFNSFYGCDVNMNNEDMQELYEFITGFDTAGNNHFAKVLNDPKLVVQLAWTALNGKQMIEDINEYWQKEITNVRKNSYTKGYEDAIKGNKSNIEIKPRSQQNYNPTLFDDLDDI